jgi:hypothetical protein
MILRISLASAALVLLAAPVLAQDRCSAPIAPVVPDGKTAAISAMTQAAKDVVAFIRASDDYQACLVTDLQTQQAAARNAKKAFDKSIENAIMAKGDANQKEKERVGAAYNASAAAYKAAH